MSIRIIPQDELGSSEKRTADMIPPLLFPRLKNLYNRGKWCSPRQKN